MRRKRSLVCISIINHLIVYFTNSYKNQRSSPKLPWNLEPSYLVILFFILLNWLMRFNFACSDATLLYSMLLFSFLAVLVFRMPLDFQRRVYFCFVIMSSIRTSIAHSHYNTPELMKDDNQVPPTLEHLEEAFEEQVRTWSSHKTTFLLIRKQQSDTRWPYLE